MDKMEKVKKALECCSKGAKEPYIPTIRYCAECPYPESEIPCTRALARDALELLKAQEPRLLTLEELTGDGECWFEHMNGACGYADCYMCTGAQAVEVNRIMHKPEYLTWDSFMKTWRCWNVKPTDDEKKAVKWDDCKG